MFDRINLDDPSSTDNQTTGVLDVRPRPDNAELTERDSRELWLAQYRFRLYFAVRRGRYLEAMLDG